MPYLRGEIYIDYLYYYPKKNQPDDKIILILNKNHVGNQDVVIVPASTNKISLPFKAGCNKTERTFYIEKQYGFYRDKTMIQFDFIENVPIKEFERRFTCKSMKKMQGKEVGGKELEDILNCIKSTKDDIAVESYKLIF